MFNSSALLLVSYGSPEKKEDIVPFLKNLFAEKRVPPERIEAAAAKYEEYIRQTGHFSPLNEECRRLIAGIRQEWNQMETKPEPPIYWGNLFWYPLLNDTVAEMKRDGIRHALCFATSAFDSASSNERYTSALEQARQKAGTDAPVLERLPLPFNHPLFLEAQTDRLLEALAEVLLEEDAKPLILFSAHSIPLVDAERSPYTEQLQWACRKVIDLSGTTIPWELVYQSRSGPAIHWLGPDIRQRISEIGGKTDGTKQYQTVIVVPIGFFCENMETQNDLDLEAGRLCLELGLDFVRAKTVGADPKICRMIVQ
jgi:ferrochelatase